jgi:ABC-type nickel/cobalt efflux system permease component RcnA
VPDWIMSLIGGLQRTIVSGLAAELRAGGLFTAVLAFALGALHALTPGHGKAAITAYFLGQQARLSTGLRVALAASLLHVVTGALAFLVLRLLIGQTPLMTARGSPVFVVAGYGLILLAGALMLVQGLRPGQGATHPHSLTAGVGLLPCPLTITVLGFAWAQGSGPMVVVVLVALAAGIACTIGTVAVLAILFRRSLGHALAGRLPGIERWTRRLQVVAGAAIMAIAAYALWRAIAP